MGIATYEGPDTGKKPLPPYLGEPFPVKLTGNAMEIAEDVWKGITPDFKVSINVLVKEGNFINGYIINKNGYSSSYSEKV